MPGSTALLRVDDVAFLQAELHARAYPFVTPGIDATDWGCELQVIDRAGSFCVEFYVNRDLHRIDHATRTLSPPAGFASHGRCSPWVLSTMR